MKKIVLALSLIAGFSVSAFAQGVKVDMSASICNKTASQYFNFKFDSGYQAGLSTGQTDRIYLKPGECQNIKFWMSNTWNQGIQNDSLQFNDLWNPGSRFNIQGIPDNNHHTINTYVSLFKLPSQYAYKETIGSDTRTLQINIIDKPKSGFVEVNHDCVRDEASGLIWAKNANLFGRKQWDYSDAAVNDMNNTPDSTGYMLCGYNDWRLPTIAEMTTLVEHGKLYGAPDSSINDWFNLNGFKRVMSDEGYFTDDSWAFSFSDGAISRVTTNIYKYYIWPVRGGQR